MVHTGGYALYKSALSIVQNVIGKSWFQRSQEYHLQHLQLFEQQRLIISELIVVSLATAGAQFSDSRVGDARHPLFRRHTLGFGIDLYVLAFIRRRRHTIAGQAGGPRHTR